MTAQDGFAERADDFAWCEEVIRRNSHSFYRAFSLLPARKRAGVYALYAFCRSADDCVDRDASEAGLAALQGALDRFLAGSVPDEPLWRALAVVFENFDMDAQPFYDLLEGQRRDLRFRQPSTLDDLEEYAYYVAGSVGLMLLPLLHVHAPLPQRLREDAVALGVAMQLTNILRDVGEDWCCRRVYLPAGVLEEAGYSLRELAEHRVNAPFRAAWEALARRSEELYLPLQRDVCLLDEDSRLPTLSSLYLYRGILDEVRAAGYCCFEHRASVPKERAVRLVSQARKQLQEGEKKERAEAGVAEDAEKGLAEDAGEGVAEDAGEGLAGFALPAFGLQDSGRGGVPVRTRAMQGR